MSAGKLGVRYERLLILAGPLSLATLVVLFIAIAADSQIERAKARCFESAANVLAEQKDTLDAAWDKARGGIDYHYAISHTWIFGLHPGSKCYQIMEKEVTDDSRDPPSHLISKLREDAKALDANLAKMPIQFYGIEMPEKATITVFGTSIKIGLITFTQLLQVGLAPLLILWLGSLYNTRFRESHLVGSATQVADIFPHSVNVYPVGRFPELRKKRWTTYYLRKVIPILYCATRMFLISVFVCPAVCSYIASLYFLPPQYLSLSLALGSLVGLSGFSNLVLELMPWHYGKMFPPANPR